MWKKTSASLLFAPSGRMNPKPRSLTRRLIVPCITSPSSRGSLSLAVLAGDAQARHVLPFSAIHFQPRVGQDALRARAHDLREDFGCNREGQGRAGVLHLFVF